MIRMICLANSWREGGRCLAGVDADGGDWIRPVPPDGGPIAEERTLVGGRRLAPLDVVELDLARPTFATRYQCENREIRRWRWRLAGKADPADLLDYRSRSNIVLYNQGKVVEPSYLESFDAPDWRSLELVHATDVSLIAHPRTPGRWQASFSLGRGGPKYLLTVTDPLATGRLALGASIRKECLLTVSLTAPIEFAKLDKPPLCYKLVAAVIEL